MNKKNSILVVDDEPTGFDVIEAHLYREGYNLTYAPSGIEALNLLHSVEPDVILLDVMMPELDGMEVCRQIKAEPRWKHIPIVMVTALSSKEDLARAIAVGADDFLSKPISGIELRARVRSMLRIKQQYDALQATLTLREDLSNMIVHDLRNPLTKIIIGGNFLLERNFPQDEVETIEIILSASRQLNSMINDLLIQAKMESGKMVLNRMDVDFNQLTQDALSEFINVAKTKNIRVESQLSETNLPILVDANLIRRVIDNLLSNAYKFSPKGSTITIRVGYCEDERSQLGKEQWQRESRGEGENLVLSSTMQMTASQSPKKAMIQIADRGIGIRDDLKQRIFEKYEVGKVMQGVTQLGLGLAFCKMVVDAHGGTILVEDNKPQGSIFTVII